LLSAPVDEYHTWIYISDSTRGRTGALYLRKSLFYQLRRRCTLLKLYIPVYDIVNYTVVVGYWCCISVYIKSRE